MMLCFRYMDFIEAAHKHGPEYFEEVTRYGIRRGPDICLSQDAYYAIREKYSTIVVPKRMLPSTRTISLPPEASPKPIKTPCRFCGGKGLRKKVVVTGRAR